MARKKKISNEPLLKEARELFTQCEAAEADWRIGWRDDLNFRALDQWPADMRRFREATTGTEPKRPCLVVDQTDQYIRQIVNDARMNPPSIKARPKDYKASIELAEQLQDWFRDIEESSRATQAYMSALEWAAVTGRGFFRIYAELVDKDRNLHEPRIGRIDNAMAVYFDPFSTELDGSDAFDAFVVQDVAPSRFKRMYPNAQATDWIDRQDANLGSWVLQDSIRIVEWDRKVVGSRTAIMTDEGEVSETKAAAQRIENFREEAVEDIKVYRRKLTAVDVLEETELLFDHVGIIPVYGNIRYTQTRRDIFGVIRAAKDPQRLLNYVVSNMAEAAALQTKAPWIAPIDAVKGHEAAWQMANTSNRAFLPYNHVDENLQPIPAPSRNIPDQSFSGLLQIANVSQQHIQSAIGMYQAAIGAPSNETSGRAITERRKGSDMSTFHYTDNLASSIQHAGRIIMDMIPRIYDVQRTIRLLSESGEMDQAVVDPNSPEPVMERKKADGTKVKVINPTIGKYDVYVSVGPSFSSKREEAAAHIGDMLARNPQLAAQVGDIYFAYQDWPGADEVAERLKKMLPPELRDDGEEEMPQPVADAIKQITQIMQVKDEASAKTLETVTKAADKLNKEKMNFQVEQANLRAVQADLATQQAKLQADQRVLDATKRELDALIAASRAGATPNGFGE